MSMMALPLGGYPEPIGVGTAATTLTSGGSANTKGSYPATPLIASAAADYQGLYLFAGNAGASNRRYAFDISIGASGSEVVVVPDIFMFLRRVITPWAAFFIPIRIPKGARVNARLQSSNISQTIDLMGVGVAAGVHQAVGFQRAEAYGVTTSSATTGVTVAPSATINTKGSWAEIVASTGNPVLGGLLLCVWSNSTLDAGESVFVIDIGVGASGSEQAIIGDLGLFVNATGDNPVPPILWLPCQIPAGTRLSARCQADASSADSLEVSLVGFS